MTSGAPQADSETTLLDCGHPEVEPGHCDGLSLCEGHAGREEAQDYGPRVEQQGDGLWACVYPCVNARRMA